MTGEIEDEFPDPVVGNIEEDCDFSELGEVSWAEEQICDADIEYALAPQREIDGLMAKIYDLETEIGRLKSGASALELSKEAFRCGYVKPVDRNGPPSDGDEMSMWELDMDQWRQSEEAWSVFADKAIAAIARLEDLRRWRPMSELPVDDRRVLARISESFIGQSMHFSQGRWLLSGSTMPDRALLDYEWTYIPGQEPKEEV